MISRAVTVIVYACSLWCFSESQKFPASFFPGDADDYIHYFLYTRKNPEMHQELKTNETDLLTSSNFDFSQKTKIIVHGWLSDESSSAPEHIKNAYLKVTDDNIINVDWSKSAKTFYTLARIYVPAVSKSLTDFLVFLVDNGVRTSDLHLIGHSLGAHIVGIAGKYYSKQMKPIRVISALDPAKPLFGWSNTENRLDKSDAVHVEVIHTCGGFLGIPDPVGHLDFYPNGGRKQPGCGWDLTGACAHNRAVLFFAESIESSVPFTSVQCKDYDEVYYKSECVRTNTTKTLNMSGLHLNFGNQGVYYLKTNAESPFALGNPDNWNKFTASRSNFPTGFGYVIVRKYILEIQKAFNKIFEKRTNCLLKACFLKKEIEIKRYFCDHYLRYHFFVFLNRKFT